MTFTNLTDETKALMQKNNISPVAVGANQYINQATPRLNAINLYNRPQQIPIQTQQNTQNSNNSMSGGINSLVNGGLSLMNGLNSMGAFNGNSNDSTGNSAISGAINSFVNSGGDDDSKASDYGDLLSDGAGIASMVKGWGGSGGSAAGGAAGGYGGLIGGGVNGLSSFAQSGDYKDGLQGMFSVDKNDSDVMQGIKGTVNGALMGGQAGGPWGALAGGILGLGSSFLDDI